MVRKNKTKEQIKQMLFQLGANLIGMENKEKIKEESEKDVIQKEMYKTNRLVLVAQKGMVDMIYHLIDGEFYKVNK